MVYTSLTSNLENPKYNLHIAHLYGDLMNTYGDNGNILMLKYVGEKLGAEMTFDIVSLKIALMKIFMTLSSGAVVKIMNKKSLRTASKYHSTTQILY